MNQQPNITISSTDASRLEHLLTSLKNSVSGKIALEAELERADIVDSKLMPEDAVTMNSTVKFKVHSSDETFCLTLVYPKDMKADGDTISILAPLGSAMLGLRQGDEINWPNTSGGSEIKVRVEEILYQPERAGEYHR